MTRNTPKISVNTRGGKPRRRVKRRIHRGRMALIVSVLAVIVIAVMVCVSRCSSNNEIFRSGGDFRRPVPEAIEAGRADAVKVLRTAPGSMEREDALLFIRSRESRLRMAGHGHAADDYINAANDYLNTHNILSN